MFKSIQTALFAAFVGVLVAGFVILFLLAAPRIKTNAVNQIGDELFKQVSLAKQEYADLLAQKAGNDLLQARANKSNELSGSRVTIIAENGIVLADSGTTDQQVKYLENHSTRPEVLGAKIKGRGISSRFSTTLGKDLIYVAVPLKDSRDNVTGYLRFSVPETYATRIVLNVQRAAVLALIAAGLLSLLLSVVFSRLFAQPIIRLSQTTKMIAQGHFPVSILHRSRFEIGELETSVENMSNRLAESFNKLSSERTQISTIIASMAEGVLAVDENNRVVLANPVIEKIFSVVSPEIVNRNVREVVRNNEIADLLSEVLKEKHMVSRELKITVPVERTFMAQANPILEKDNNAKGAVCVLYDITELRKLERYRSEFVANVSHELKTPLTSISGYVETLLDGKAEDKENTARFLKKIEKHTRNLSGLIDDILEMAQLESKRELGPFKEVDVSSLVLRAVETISGKAEAKNISIKKCCAGEPCLIMGIEDPVYRAILNLLDNAVNYTPADGRIEVSCGKKENAFEISVVDNGLGIPPEHLERIFERFYRVDTARSRELGGTGLGLSIVKHVMNIHNGSVAVDSQFGKGSRFTLSFPA